MSPEPNLLSDAELRALVARYLASPVDRYAEGRSVIARSGKRLATAVDEQIAARLVALPRDLGRLLETLVALTEELGLATDALALAHPQPGRLTSLSSPGAEVVALTPEQLRELAQRHLPGGPWQVDEHTVQTLDGRLVATALEPDTAQRLVTEREDLTALLATVVELTTRCLAAERAAE